MLLVGLLLVPALLLPHAPPPRGIYAPARCGYPRICAVVADGAAAPSDEATETEAAVTIDEVVDIPPIEETSAVVEEPSDEATEAATPIEAESAATVDEVVETPPIEETSAVAEETPAASESTVTIKPPAVSDEETVRATAATWADADAAAKTSAKAGLAKLEKDFDTSQDKTAIKEQLIGSWKLLIASDASGRYFSKLSSGIAGYAEKPYQNVVGHFQTFSKPDPMDIFSGGAKDKFFMETSEVVTDAKFGTASVATLKGGFHVGQLASVDLGVVEYYPAPHSARVPVPVRMQVVGCLPRAHASGRTEMHPSPAGAPGTTHGASTAAVRRN